MNCCDVFIEENWEDEIETNGIWFRHFIHPTSYIWIQHTFFHVTLSLSPTKYVPSFPFSSFVWIHYSYTCQFVHLLRKLPSFIINIILGIKRELILPILLSTNPSQFKLDFSCDFKPYKKNIRKYYYLF